MITKIKLLISACLLMICVAAAKPGAALIPPPGPQSSSTGVEGTIPGPAPSQAATIAIPKNGQTFSTLPITVSGFCPNNTLVEIYKNNVFAGSAECKNGSYSLQIDLFDDRNDLVAKVFDNLNQAGPDSSTVTVFFTSGVSASTGPRLLLTTQYAKRGADPGAILSWPITISGGTAPYALSVDWGDDSEPDLISQQVAGDFTLQHTFAQAGVYNVIIKASDAKGNAAFLQVVGVGNGKIQQAGTTGTSGSANNSSGANSKVMWWPIGVLFGLSIVAYWLGQKHQLEAIRNRLRRGEQPF